MDEIIEKNSKYINVLNRVQKRFYTYECILIMKKQYYINNSFYYFLCLIFRFIHILSFCGDYNSSSRRPSPPANSMNPMIRSNTTSIKQYLNNFTLYYLVKQLNMSYTTYFIINLIILVLYLARTLYLLRIIKKFNKSKHTDNWILPNKYQIIIDHIIFLLFPYIIEYLSFVYYMCFFPDDFIIKSNNANKVALYFFTFINTILIILYNIENYFGIVCVNRIYKTTIFEANSSIRDKNFETNKSILYISIFRDSNITFIQNK